MESGVVRSVDAVVVRSAYLAFGEKLYADDEGKDLRLELSDGTSIVHSAVLRAVSDPFRQMLSGEMGEARSKLVRMTDVARVGMDFFLRLLYTGQVDSRDWLPDGSELKETGAEQAKYRVIVQGDCSERHRLEGTYCHGGVFRGSPVFVNDHGAVLYYGQGGFWKLSCTLGRELARYTDTTDDGAIGWHFSQSGGTSSEPPARPWDATRSTGSWNGNRASDVVVLLSREDTVPMSLLLAAYGIAKKYMVQHMLGWLAEVISEQLSPACFEESLAAAIRWDDPFLRMRCLRFAESSSEIRDKYEQRSYTVPEVMYELQVLWPKREAKRRRML